MGETPVYHLPWPEPLDVPDVPVDLEQLAQATEAAATGLDGRLDVLEAALAISLGPPLATSLPGSPVDGQEIYYQTAAMATSGIVWHLRYRSGAAGSYKWEYLGGSPLYAERLPDANNPSMPGGTWGNFDANDPQITVPLAGDYRAEHSANLTPTTTICSVGIGLTVAGVVPVTTTNATFQYVAAAGGHGALEQKRLLTAIAAATLVRQGYFQGGGVQSVNARGRALRITPVRVG